MGNRELRIEVIAEIFCDAGVEAAGEQIAKVVDDFCGFLEFECEISMNSHVNATQKQPEDVSKLKQEIERLNRELAIFKQGVGKRLNKQDLFPTNIYVKNNEVFTTFNNQN
jgi:hypothetical protein